VNGFDEPQDEQAPEEESFGRPFLGRAIQSDPLEEPGSPIYNDMSAEHNRRPYLMTGGRTGGGASGIGIETTLVRDRAAALGNWSREMSMIVQECDTPVAVAEVAARTELPIGVVQVLAGDLVAAGVLLRSASAASMSLADDVNFIERLIHGVAAL
jgi:hypothetical protein